jgi:hypothetical protein
MPERKEENKKSGMLIKILIGLATVVFIAFMFPRGESIESEITVGSVWTHEDLIAPFSFPIKKDPKVYQSEISAAVAGVYPVFVKKSDAVANSVDSLKIYNAYLEKITRENHSTDSSGDQNPTFLSEESFNIIKSLFKKEYLLSGDQRISLNKFLSDIERK